jgi:hypothetical protein
MPGTLFASGGFGKGIMPPVIGFASIGVIGFGVGAGAPPSCVGKASMAAALAAATPAAVGDGLEPVKGALA